MQLEHADFNNLRWLKGAVIILSLVKTGSRISSVSFYTRAATFIMQLGLSFIAAARGGCKNKSCVGWTQMASSLNTLSMVGRKRKMQTGAWV